ncbi:hypothetical protein [Streptomyces sp. NPDC085665]|uniref:hypothetical protein n=1 Tax=Streptomyces sp. NPDC085665 TaxID=3365735 RepID=UPI0037D8FA56
MDPRGRRGRATRTAQYKGLTPGANDRTPRRTAPDARVPEVAAALAGRYEVSTRTAERLIARARTHTA